MYQATKDIVLPTSIIGSLPNPQWYTNTLGSKTFIHAMVNSQFREQYTDAVSSFLRDQEVAGLDHPQIRGLLDESRALVAWSQGRFDEAEQLLTTMLEAARRDRRTDYQRLLLRSLTRLAEATRSDSIEALREETRALDAKLAEQFETEDERRTFLSAPIVFPVWVGD